MPEPTEIKIESPAVQSYLTILQTIINRMAANSSSCKAWCITLVSAIMVIVADKGKPQYLSISIVPVALFLFLDSYYLGLERLFRKLYNSFIQKIHSGTASIDDVFIVKPGSTSEILNSATGALFSFSIWPFYSLLLIMWFIIKTIIF